MDKFELRLEPDDEREPPREDRRPYPPTAPESVLAGLLRRDHPVMGYFAVGFGILGIFTHGYVFVPLGFLCGVIALFLGQWAWGVVGVLLSMAGLATSPVLLTLLGLGWLGMMIGW